MDGHIFHNRRICLVCLVKENICLVVCVVFALIVFVLGGFIIDLYTNKGPVNIYANAGPRNLQQDHRLFLCFGYTV